MIVCASPKRLSGTKVTSPDLATACQMEDRQAMQQETNSTLIQQKLATTSDAQHIAILLLAVQETATAFGERGRHLNEHFAPLYLKEAYPGR
jgi:hypothetical protein